MHPLKPRRSWAMPVICAAIHLIAGAVSSASAQAVQTQTPIRYLVVLFQENNSFDHYFGTYPNAANPPGEPVFVARPNTPTVNGLNNALLSSNPNSIAPFRLDRSQAWLNCDNNNGYIQEQAAWDHGLVDQFPQNTSAAASAASGAEAACPTGVAMGYYDGNTVTALWNYAQYYAMSDNFYDSQFGTTVMGHLNLISGQTHQTYEPGNVLKTGAKTYVIRNGSVIANLDSAVDDCVSAPVNGQPVASVAMTGANIGNLLNNKNVTWGWFYADFAAQAGSTPTQAVCSSLYNVHYDPFQYYPSTANPHHLAPLSLQTVGYQDQANHQYDINTLQSALAAGNLPAVSFVKTTSTQTGHPQDGSTLSEQTYLVDMITMLMNSPQWYEMAIVIAYDDSDGWYDHVMPPIMNQSNDPGFDSICGSGTLAATAYNDRCGYGSRLPFLVISPFAKANYVDHTLLDTTSIMAFIEYNWGLGTIDSLDHPNGTPQGNPPAGQGSFDRMAGSLLGFFNFEFDHLYREQPNRVILDDMTGEVQSITGTY